jgi:hypothetical protein
MIEAEGADLVAELLGIVLSFSNTTPRCKSKKFHQAPETNRNSSFEEGDKNVGKEQSHCA